MYGLLGKKLGHSYSKEIHETITNTKYTLYEVDKLDLFFNNVKFRGINVTIPYKTQVIPYLDELSTIAKETNTVNTIFFKSGKLIGYNTDYYGIEKTLQLNDISVSDKEVIILGNGSTSNTIRVYCERNLAKKITILARNPKENEYHFSDVDNFKTSEIIFNTTPVGMFPNNNGTLPLDLQKFPNLSSVVDVVYNPSRSNLLIDAEKYNIKAINGLFMLICQAVKSIELFHSISISDIELINLYRKIKLQTSNIVFIGMPMSGKTYFSKYIANYYNKNFIDLDTEIEKTAQMPIKDIFREYDEKHFRNLESNEVKKIYKTHNKAISCGGGIILDALNMKMLKQNGIILFIDAPLSLLRKCNPKNRPLLKNKDNLDKLFNTRYNLYKKYADIVIKKERFNEETTFNEIEVKLNEYLSS